MHEFDNLNQISKFKLGQLINKIAPGNCLSCIEISQELLNMVSKW